LTVVAIGVIHYMSPRLLCSLISLGEFDGMIQAKLLVIGGEVEADELVLQLPATIGRSREATINLSHPLVSRQHCELFEANGCLMVRDLDSLNGTFVGSQRVSESVVQPGDLLTVGTVTFRAVYNPVPSSNGAKSAADTVKKPAHRRQPKATSATADETEETHRLGEKETLQVRSGLDPDGAADSVEVTEGMEERVPRAGSSEL
jgi:predicted component of type VI protein secretion system